MKTVKDAVKEFNGVWPYPQYRNILALIDEGLWGISWTTSATHKDKICTRKEFEDYAKTQKLNSINKEAIKPLNNNHECGQVEKVKPVYTQEMADNGELPPVGSKVLLRYNFDSKTTTHTGEVLFASEHYCILWTNFGECCYKIGGYIYEAIDTHKDEEKLVDEVAKQLHQSYINTTDIVKCDDYFKSDARWLLTKFDITLK